MRDAAQQLQVEVQHQGSDSVVSLSGELDIGTTALLEAGAADAFASRCRRISLYLAHLEFVDVAGLRCIQAVIDQARDRSAEVRLVGANGRFRRTAALAGLAFVESLDGPATANVGRSQLEDAR